MIIRTHLTFTFDETKITEREIKDRLDELLTNEFDDGTGRVDVHARWIAELSDSALFGAAKEKK